jgi:hypothetical protein
LVERPDNKGNRYSHEGHTNEKGSNRCRHFMKPNV